MAAGVMTGGTVKGAREARCVRGSCPDEAEDDDDEEDEENDSVAGTPRHSRNRQ